MTTVPDELAAVVDRVTMAPLSEPVSDPALTGALRDLAAWWAAVSGGAAVHSLHMTAPDQPDADAVASVVAGVAAADAAVDSGATLLVPRVSRRHDTLARTIIGALTKVEPQALVPQPVGLPDRQWMSTVTQVRDGVWRGTVNGTDALALIDNPDADQIAWCAGVLLGAAARRTACLVDGTDESAAALVADRLSSRASSWWTSGSQSADPARAAMADRAAVNPGPPLGLSDDAGMGIASTLALLDVISRR